jgi:hypothetical protein
MGNNGDSALNMSAEGGGKGMETCGKVSTPFPRFSMKSANSRILIDVLPLKSLKGPDAQVLTF